uniref:C-C motif chemokine 17-like n=1 Tax=Poecilia reticulata TaxID=8081 RepID=A0A3P9PBE2_POERE
MPNTHSPLSSSHFHSILTLNRANQCISSDIPMRIIFRTDNVEIMHNYSAADIKMIPGYYQTFFLIAFLCRCCDVVHNIIPRCVFCSPGKGVQMQRDVQCCMLYSQGKVRTKDVLRFEVQTEGPDCSIQAIILYTKKAVKCADPRDRKVKRLLRKLLQRQRLKNHRTMWLLPRDNLPAMSEDKKDNWAVLNVE